MLVPGGYKPVCALARMQMQGGDPKAEFFLFFILVPRNSAAVCVYRRTGYE